MKKVNLAVIMSAAALAICSGFATAQVIAVNVAKPDVVVGDCSIKCVDRVRLTGASVAIWGTNGTSINSIWGTEGTSLTIMTPDVTVPDGDVWGTGVASDPILEIGELF